MFGIGLGEILVILLVIFLVSPGDLPKVFRKLAELRNLLSQMQNEVSKLEKDINLDATPVTRSVAEKKEPAPVTSEKNGRH